MEKVPQNEKLDILKLYSISIDQIKYYNGIIWQFPTALAGVNYLALNYFYDKSPIVVLTLSIINFSMIYALYRHLKNFDSILEANIEIEEKLRKDFKEMVPKFNKPKIKSTKVIIITFTIANGCLFLSSLFKMFERFIDCLIKAIH